MVARILRAAYEIDVYATAQRVSCPTLVLHSRVDAVVPFESGRVVAGLTPGAHFVPMESCSHLPMVTESAWQLLQTEVALFLDTVRAAPVILHGSRDVITPLASSEKLLELIPNAKPQVADGAGHVPTITRPQWVAEQIEKFFAEV